MMRRTSQYGSDDAHLQADVMRFMAIVAFCLVAILAMVRNLSEVEEVEEAEVEIAAVTELVAEKVAVPEPQPIAPPPEPEPVQQAPQQRQAEPVKEPEDKPRVFVVAEQTFDTPVQPAPEPQPVEPLPTEPLPAESVPVPEEVEREVKEDTQVNEVSEEIESDRNKSQEDQGLTLRFASQSDFLRLIARTKVMVYAFNPQTFLEMNEQYRFLQTKPPRQVYELDPSTIPVHLQEALPRDMVDVKWAVGLPPKIERQVQSLVNAHASGELLINRFEEVHHVASR